MNRTLPIDPIAMLDSFSLQSSTDSSLDLNPVTFVECVNRCHQSLGLVVALVRVLKGPGDRHRPLQRDKR